MESVSAVSVSNLLLTHGMFTRTGPQCAVCSAWKRPCPRCGSSANAVQVTEAMLSRSISAAEYSEEHASEMASAVVRTGNTANRVRRAATHLGMVEVHPAWI